MDVARAEGIAVDAAALQNALGLPVVAVDPRKRDVRGLREVIDAQLAEPAVTLRPVATTDDFELADARFAWVDAAVEVAATDTGHQQTFTERLDRFALHPVIGPLMFLVAMWMVFEITTTVAKPLQDGLEGFFGCLLYTSPSPRD